jgi:hypothetical protein
VCSSDLDEDRAEKLNDDCKILTGDGRVHLFGARPMHYTQALDMSATIAQIETLNERRRTPQFRAGAVVCPSSEVEV